MNCCAHATVNFTFALALVKVKCARTECMVRCSSVIKYELAAITLPKRDNEEKGRCSICALSGCVIGKDVKTDLILPFSLFDWT